MNTHDVAKAFTDLCKAGEFEQAGRQFWAPSVKSIEPMEGPMQVADGLEAVLAKGEWWYANHEVHSIETTGPWVNGNQFVVRFIMDVTAKETGQRDTGDEAALYTVEDGKIIEERFFY